MSITKTGFSNSLFTQHIFSIQLFHTLVLHIQVLKGSPAIQDGYCHGFGVAQLDRDPPLTCVCANIRMSFFSLGKRSSLPASRAVTNSRSDCSSSRPSAPRHSCSRAIQSRAICERMSSSNARLL